MAGATWFDLLTGLVGGIALFLLGIQQFTRALQNLTSGRLHTFLVRVSGTPLRGAVSGGLATSVIQSSTATVLLIVGFVAAGAMTLTQSVAVVLGANVGTTLTIQIIAFDVTRFALLMVGVGFGITMVRPWRAAHGPGRALLAVGLVFLGMDVMARAVAPLRDSPLLADVVTGDTGLLVGLAAGAVFTVIVQSSSATSGVLVVLASQGLLDLRMGIAVLMGASLGTCVSPLIAGLGTHRAGLRVAVTHALVNVVGVGVAIWLVVPLADLAVALSPSHPELTGMERLAAETPRQLANAYTIFKLGILAVFLGLTRQLAVVVERLVPDRPDVDPVGARYLDDDALDAPEAALELVRRELVRLGEEVTAVVTDALSVVLHGSDEDLDALAARDHRIDAIYDDVMVYLARIGSQELSSSQSARLLTAITVAGDLETIGDIVETNLVQIGKRRLAEGVRPSAPTTRVVTTFHATVVARLGQVVDALASLDLAAADEIVATKPEVMAERDRAVAHLTTRLRADAPNRIRSYEREVEVVAQLQRIAAQTRHVARTLTGDRTPPGNLEA